VAKITACLVNLVGHCQRRKYSRDEMVDLHIEGNVTSFNRGRKTKWVFASKAWITSRGVVPVEGCSKETTDGIL